MIISEVDLMRCPDVGLLREHGYAVRDVFVERKRSGDYCVNCLNEFTNSEILLGVLRPTLKVVRLIDEWLDVTRYDGLMAIYVDEFEVVVIDYYHALQ